MIAAIAPGLSSWISAICRPRSHTRRIPSSAPRAPAATAAVYSPRLCPATKSGRRPVPAGHLVHGHGESEQRRLGHVGARERLDRPVHRVLAHREARELVGAAQVALEQVGVRIAQVGSHPHLLRALPGVQKREFAHGAGTLTEPRSAVIPAGVAVKLALNPVNQPTSIDAVASAVQGEAPRPGRAHLSRRGDHAALQRHRGLDRTDRGARRAALVRSRAQSQCNRARGGSGARGNRGQVAGRRLHARVRQRPLGAALRDRSRAGIHRPAGGASGRIQDPHRCPYRLRDRGFRRLLRSQCGAGSTDRRQASGGEILVSSAAKQYTESDPTFRFEHRGELRLKGLVGEHSVYALAWDDQA